MALMTSKTGALVRSSTVKGEQNLKNRTLAEPALVPLAGDGEHTKAALAEMQNFMRTQGYADKITAWKKQLREARYKDWLAAQGR